ncbi:unnamed protein product [Pleuronectes platessa]|uniref:Uncharacterized protein n=1 Tax=Pleuronectes platessa TaxID=8262 RepID=A0A9N7Z3P6_PLEPL|nr:unnamed protein product [Pleuronectes platessa]
MWPTRSTGDQAGILTEPGVLSQRVERGWSPSLMPRVQNHRLQLRVHQLACRKLEDWKSKVNSQPASPARSMAGPRTSHIPVEPRRHDRFPASSGGCVCPSCAPLEIWMPLRLEAALHPED